MPLYTVRCPNCSYTLEDMLCSYVEAQSKQCPKCGKVMGILPQSGSVIWSCDTEFSSSKKTVKE